VEHVKTAVEGSGLRRLSGRSAVIKQGFHLHLDSSGVELTGVQQPFRGVTFFLIVVIGGASRAYPAPSSQSFLALREEARQVLRIHCGACHMPFTPTSQERALRIFDLSIENWAGSMKESQLGDSLRRLEERQKLTPSELAEVVPRGAPRPSRPNSQETEVLKKFIGLERIHRLPSRTRTKN
jgi:hypothetical protein